MKYNNSKCKINFAPDVEHQIKSLAVTWHI